MTSVASAARRQFRIRIGREQRRADQREAEKSHQQDRKGTAHCESLYTQTCASPNRHTRIVGSSAASVPANELLGGRLDPFVLPAVQLGHFDWDGTSHILAEREKNFLRARRICTEPSRIERLINHVAITRAVDGTNTIEVVESHSPVGELTLFCRIIQ